MFFPKKAKSVEILPEQGKKLVFFVIMCRGFTTDTTSCIYAGTGKKEGFLLKILVDRMQVAVL